MLHLHIIDTFSVPRLLGIPCDQVSMAIVSQIKSMGSYKVKKQTKTHTFYINIMFILVAAARLFLQNAYSAFQLGPVAPYLIQANHTSSLGQVESVNFTITSIAMSMGCHVEVRDIKSVYSKWNKKCYLKP